jgi:hypothetical protein
MTKRIDNDAFTECWNRHVLNGGMVADVAKELGISVKSAVERASRLRRGRPAIKPAQLLHFPRGKAGGKAATK